MLIVLSLCVSALSLFMFPILLARGTWWVRSPRLALGAWAATVVLGGLGFAVAAAAWFLPEPMWLRPGCGGCGPVGAFLIGVLQPVAAGFLLALVGARAERLWRRSRRTRLLVLQLAAGAVGSHGSRGGATVSLVEDAIPMALAARVSGGCVLITTALERELSSEELLSVIDHEEAHLRLGHDRWVWLAQLNRECFPWLLSARLLAERVGLLVELVADDEAARSRGVAATSGALARLGELREDESSWLRSRRVREVHAGALPA